MENALAVPAFASTPVRPSVVRADVRPPAPVRPKATPCAFKPIHRLPPLRAITPPKSLMRSPATASNIGIQNLDEHDLSTPTSDLARLLAGADAAGIDDANPPDMDALLADGQEMNQQAQAAQALRAPDERGVSALQKVENFLNELMENPEYRDLAKTVIANGAALIELSRFLHKALDDFKLASTLTGGGIMTVVVGLALIISGGQIAQKIPGSQAALKAKTDFCVKKITDEVAAQTNYQQINGLPITNVLVQGAPEFDLAVETCVQELRTIPSTNKLNLTVFKDFVRDVLMHIQNVIALFNRPQASPVAA